MKKLRKLILPLFILPLSFLFGCNQSRTYAWSVSAIHCKVNESTGLINSNQDINLTFTPDSKYMLSSSCFTITVNNVDVPSRSDYWTFENNNLSVKSAVITGNVLINAVAIEKQNTYSVAVTKDEHVKEYGGSFPAIAYSNKDLEIKFTIDTSYGLIPTVRINGDIFENYTLVNNNQYISLIIKSDYIVGDIDISLKTEYGKITVTPSSISIKNYDTHDLYVYDPLGRDIKYSTSSSAFTVTEISEPKGYRIDSISDDICSDAELKITAGSSEVVVPIDVYHPKNQQEALDSVTLAFVKGLTSFNITFDYNNSETFSTFADHLEITENMYYSGGVGLYGTLTSSGGSFSIGSLKAHGRDYAYDNTIDEDKYYRPVTSANAKIMGAHSSTRNKLKIDSSYQCLTVYNSEELFWAVEHGYYPLFDSSSTSSKKAETIFNKGLEIVKKCTSENMDLVTELITIFNVLEDMITYDYNASSSSVGYPGWLKFPAYFMDGVFLNGGVAVCDGFSKSYAFLCGLDGLPVVRSFGYTSDAGHAWNYAKVNGSWYLICPTWAKDNVTTSQTTFYSRNFSIYNYGSFLMSKNYFYNASGGKYEFTDLAFPLINKSETDYEFNALAYSNFTYNSITYSFNPKTSDDFVAIAKKCEELNMMGTEFYIILDASSLTQETIVSYIKNALSKLSTKPNNCGMMANSDFSYLVWEFK